MQLNLRIFTMSIQRQSRDTCSTLQLDERKLPSSFLHNKTLFCGLEYPSSLPLANLTSTSNTRAEMSVEARHKLTWESTACCEGPVHVSGDCFHYCEVANKASFGDCLAQSLATVGSISTCNHQRASSGIPLAVGTSWKMGMGLLALLVFAAL